MLSVDKSGILAVTAEENTSGTRRSLEKKKEGSFYKQNEKSLIKNLLWPLLLKNEIYLILIN